MQSGSGPFNSQQQQPPSSGQSTAQDMDTSASSNEEVWVETKSADGKSYYYHAKSRETTWTKPEGPNIKVLSQQQVRNSFSHLWVVKNDFSQFFQVEAMAQQQTAGKPADGGRSTLNIHFKIFEYSLFIFFYIQVHSKIRTIMVIHHNSNHIILSLVGMYHKLLLLLQHPFLVQAQCLTRC